MTDKFILDACCGGKHMWFNKNNPNTIYIDIRREKKGHNPREPNHTIEPDEIMDFRKMSFPDKSFKLIVFDPPFQFLSDTSYLAKSYGNLKRETWESDYKMAFKEIWRCLEDYGVLIFKFNDKHIKFDRVLDLFPIKPLFGNVASTGTKSITKWFCFMKIPDALAGEKLTKW